MIHIIPRSPQAHGRGVGGRREAAEASQRSLVLEPCAQEWSQVRPVRQRTVLDNRREHQGHEAGEDPALAHPAAVTRSQPRREILGVDEAGVAGVGSRRLRRWASRPHAAAIRRSHPCRGGVAASSARGCSMRHGPAPGMPRSPQAQGCGHAGMRPRSTKPECCSRPPTQGGRVALRPGTTQEIAQRREESS